MSQQPKIEITPEQVEIVQTILVTYLPSKSSVFVFGSRAKGNPKPHSDLDLAIDADGQPLNLVNIGQLNEAFDESLLPYKVDIVDLNTLDQEFKKLIETDCIEFKISQGYKI